MDIYTSFIYFIFNFMIGFVSTDFYSSVTKITQLSQKELRLVNGLRRYITAEEKEGRHVKETITRLLKSAELEVNNTTEIDNPIDAFHLLRRWVDDWGKCFDDVFCPDCSAEGPTVDFNLTRGIVEKRLNGWPTQHDIDAVISAMIRLLDVYDFDLHDFLHGRIYKFQTKPFTPEEIIYIAHRADEMDDLYSSIRFLETLLVEVKTGKFPDSDIDVTKLARMTAAAYYKNDMSWKSVDLLTEYVKSDPTNERLKKDFEYFKAKADSIPVSKKVTELKKPDTDTVTLSGEVYYDIDLIKDYKALCRGHIKTEKELSRLYCYNKLTSVPFYTVKTELANLQPRIFIFHDIISEKEMSFIQNRSTNQLEPSGVIPDHSTKQIVKEDNIRISSTTWLSDVEHPVLRKLTKRMKLITGLETKYKRRFSNSEQYQVLNYGIGGMYRPHIDPLFIPSTNADQSGNPPEVQFSGDRIATFLIYLSDVMYGGATVFPKLKARIPVQKGSAVFWYNLDLKGEVDYNMYHAGCPVLVGSKWVSNKWIREIGQAFTHPCGLKRSSKDRNL